MKNSPLSIILAASFFMGCATAEFAPSKVAQTYQPRKSADQIEVFRTQLPQRKFIEIGSVMAWRGKQETLINLLRQQAAEHGGDAIIGLEPQINGMAATVIRFQ